MPLAAIIAFQNNTILQRPVGGGRPQLVFDDRLFDDDLAALALTLLVGAK
jgi:hypothetical protein